MFFFSSLFSIVNPLSFLQWSVHLLIPSVMYVDVERWKSNLNAVFILSNVFI